MGASSVRVLSVTQLNEYVGGMLAHDPLLRNVKLTGEVSNFRVTASGHAYFALKDEQSLIRCVMFKSDLSRLSRLPEDGSAVIIGGYVSLYAKDGQYQFYARTLELAGAGELFLRFERTKKKLEERGWFDPSIKKPLPKIPRTVGVVTSATGAVLHDILNVAKRRFPGYDILLAPAAVQGSEAPAELAAAIAALDGVDSVSVIIVARGGGSMEDLWAFNDERVAKAIYDCKKPVVSAVGHETDFTIADFVADLRAPTPSAAAELVWPMLSERLDELYTLVFRMERAVHRNITQQRAALAEAYSALLPNDPIRAVERDMQTLDHLAARMIAAVKGQSRMFWSALSECGAKLDASSPLSTMKRGYAYVERSGKGVVSAAELSPGAEISLTFADGKAQATVTGLETRKEERE
ncbi:MAG: exodeoxyribonuclease VII large subunit [Christensenellales bacterium]|jgi:exodeoxyribonuclease VII large subunit